MIAHTNGVMKMIGSKRTGNGLRVARASLKRASCLTLLAGCTFVAACGSHQKDQFRVGSIPQDYRTKHPIVVGQSETVEDLLITSEMKGMSFRHENLVRSILVRYRKANASRLRVMIPSGSPNTASAKAVARDVLAFMRDQGVPRSHVEVTHYSATNHGDAATLRLSFDSLKARVATNCGKWDEDLNFNSDNTNYTNFGCATQNNLAEIIANPADLIAPRGESEIDAERRDNVIEDYRSDGTPSLGSIF